MLKLPGDLTADAFLGQYWQKQALFMPGAIARVRPSITRNELAWLATLEDVESRLVFVECNENRRRYHAETGPFDPEYLKGLPGRDWTLLVHDVEKHLPTMRSLFQQVPFIPDWRIDDLMVSFAAPGGGVGPHKDNYDVFLCQGIGIRNWRYSSDDIADDPDSCDDLALLSEFEGAEDIDTSAGDVVYLPPGVPHWGTAKRACMTYSIGMRAPQASDISFAPGCSPSHEDAYYRDPDLHSSEAMPGYISNQSTKRAAQLLDLPASQHDEIAEALGRFATQNKDWLRPEEATADEVETAICFLQSGGNLRLHGMGHIAFDEKLLYVNGSSTRLRQDAAPLVRTICAGRRLSGAFVQSDEETDAVRWMLQRGAFEIPENCRPYVK